MIVSNDRANATAARLGRGVVTVVPVTSNVAKIFPFQVLLPAVTSRSGGRLEGAGRTNQIRCNRAAAASDRPSRAQ